MKLYKTTILFLLATILVVYISYAQDSISLNLESAIELALQKNTEIAIANYQVNTSEFALKVAKGTVTDIDFTAAKAKLEKMDLTEEAFILAKKRYEFGVGTFLEVNNAELSFTQTRLFWLQAISDNKAAYYDYQLLIGKD
ncbi:MAG: TolC family protein [Lutibacter sp.]|nr:TolC family protein [Lutibacter sp.]